MKVIGIVGSPRKNGNTELLTKHTLKAISEEGLDTELIRLAGLEIKPCNACMACQKQEICSIKDDLFPVPQLFQIIQEESGTEWREMYQVFNMGHRFEIYTDPETAEGIRQVASGYRIDARIIGRCEQADHIKLTIKSDQGEFIY